MSVLPRNLCALFCAVALTSSASTSALLDSFVQEIDILSGISPVVHKEELNVLDVVDEEGLVARGHHVLGLLVGAIADLNMRKI